MTHQVPIIPITLLIFGAKYQKHLLIARDLIQIYETIERNVTSANIQWVLIIKNFGEQFKSLTDRIKYDDPDTTNISKALPIIKWNKSFRDHIHN